MGNAANVVRYDLEGRFKDFAEMICIGSCKTHKGIPPRAVVVCSGVTTLQSISIQVGRGKEIHKIKIIVNDDIHLRRDQVGLDED